MSFFNGIIINDSTNMDASGRLRVSESANFFSGLLQYNTNPLLVEYGSSGTGVTGTYSTTSKLVTLTVAAGTGTSWSQTFEYYPITAGKSTQFACVGVIGAGVANVTVDMGAFDLTGGVFLRQNGVTNLQLIRRSSVSGVTVDNTVNQSAWNVDKLDGTGPSGKTLDITKLTTVVIDMQFASRARVGFIIDGVLIYAHTFYISNTIAEAPFGYQAKPIQMLVTATASGGSKSSFLKGMLINAEGGFRDNFAFTLGTPEGTTTAGSGTRTHLLSIRPKTTFNGITNRVFIRVDLIDLLVTGNNPLYWELCLGCTFSVAPTYADVNTTNSGTEYGINGTLSTVGVVISSGYLPASNATKASLSLTKELPFPISLNRAGAQTAGGTLSLIVTGIGGTSTCRGTFDISEIR